MRNRTAPIGPYDGQSRPVKTQNHSLSSVTQFYCLPLPEINQKWSVYPSWRRCPVYNLIRVIMIQLEYTFTCGMWQAINWLRINFEHSSVFVQQVSEIHLYAYPNRRRGLSVSLKNQFELLVLIWPSSNEKLPLHPTLCYLECKRLRLMKINLIKLLR